MTAYCIFQEPWWLDAVAPNAWQSLEVVEGGQIVARMPIVLHRKLGFRVIRQPPLTQVLGPWIRTSCASEARRLAREKRLLNELIDQLPRWDYFEANFHRGMINWLPFYWRGFQQTTRYTYVLEETADIEKVWGQLQENVRRNVRKAQRTLRVRTDMGLDHLLNLVEATFERQGQELPFSRNVMHRLDAACSLRGARRMFFAEDARGRLHAALYLVMDTGCAYYLLGGANPALRESGAQNLLLWEAIRCASEMRLSFDFEGSMLEPVERVFRGFGACQAPYMRVYGARPLARLLLNLLPAQRIRAVANRLD